MNRHIVREDVRLFVIAVRRLKCKDQVKNMVDSVEIEKLGAKGKKQ